MSETERLRFDIYKSPLDDVRVRLTINYAIERKGLIGTVNPATYQIAQKYVMPTINGFDPNVQPCEYTPERAKQLVSRASCYGARK
ncbi:hypothetical protein H0241_19835 [Mesorhizobium sp. CCANP35]|uniref:Solute-binding protein family 5 domain-containing protein n=1 Tax=Mesorhizobium neociceri TaxID=1307853 RepID=A0A838B936_9HYPH|nr:hypothetical protein [Mesorhizobium neociceri]